jgi:Mn2+/Fe2+ NRAMP family transporter
VFVFLMGVGLIITKGYNPLEQLWVGLAIVLFLITFTYANLVQNPTVRKMVAFTSQPPPIVVAADQPGEQPAMTGPGTPAVPGAGPAAPPPEFVALSAKAARGGQFMMAMIFIILALMVVKPF